MNVLRDLDEEAMKQYRAPFLDPSRRKPLLRWPTEVPIAGEPADVASLVTAYNRWLQQTELPKLLVRARSGSIIGEQLIEWCQDHMKNFMLAE